MTSINQELITSLMPGKILSVQVGFSRTAVLARTEAGLRCGLAATLSNPCFEHHIRPAVRQAGLLHHMSSAELAGLIESDSFTEVSIGLAAVNALLPRCPEEWVELNAEDYLAQEGAGKNIVVVGHFPFIEKLRAAARNVWVLELNPREGDLPASEAPRVVPQADVLAVTATTLINKTFQGLIDLCLPDAKVVLIGPSAPLSPVLYAHGVHVISGTVVAEPEAALLGVSQGISLSQMRAAGMVRLVTMKKDG